MIALGMNGRVIEWVLGIGNTEEACALLEGSITQTLHLLELGTRGERTVFTSVINDVAGKGRTESADVGEQVEGSRVEVDTHLIDTTHHRLVE